MSEIYLGTPSDSIVEYVDRKKYKNRLLNVTSACYSVCQAKEATMPVLSAQTPENLSGTIDSIPVGYQSGDLDVPVTGSIIGITSSGETVTNNVCGSIGNSIFGSIGTSTDEHNSGGYICGNICGKDLGEGVGHVAICGNVCGIVCGNVCGSVCGSLIQLDEIIPTVYGDIANVDIAVCGNICGRMQGDVIAPNDSCGTERAAICGNILGGNNYSCGYNNDVAVCGSIYGNVTRYSSSYGEATIYGNVEAKTDEYEYCGIAICGTVCGSIQPPNCGQIGVYGDIRAGWSEYGYYAVIGSVNGNITSGVFGTICGYYWDGSNMAVANGVYGDICGGVIGNIGYSYESYMYGTAVYGYICGNVTRCIYGGDDGATIYGNVEAKTSESEFCGVAICGMVCGSIQPPEGAPAVFGNICGSINGDVYGGVCGNVFGGVSGCVYGDAFGVCGSVYGGVASGVYGDVYGIHDGNLYGGIDNGAVYLGGTAGSTVTLDQNAEHAVLTINVSDQNYYIHVS